MNSIVGQDKTDSSNCIVGRNAFWIPKRSKSKKAASTTRETKVAKRSTEEAVKSTADNEDDNTNSQRQQNCKYCGFSILAKAINQL
jgi:hypothetical protein